MALDKPMSNEDPVASIHNANTNFKHISNKFRTNIIKDETGTPRIIFGALPDGTYGLVISEAGVSVLSLF